jgi:hypothetical protein
MQNFPSPRKTAMSTPPHMDASETQDDGMSAIRLGSGNGKTAGKVVQIRYLTADSTDSSQ